MIDKRIKQAEKILNESIADQYENALVMCAEILGESLGTMASYLAHEIRCSIYSELGNTDQAIKEASAMIGLEENQPHPFFRRALLLLRSGKNLEAIADLTKVLQFNDTYFRETALFFRSYANLEFDRAQAMRDAILLEDGFTYFVKTSSLGRKEISKEDLLRMAGG